MTGQIKYLPWITRNMLRAEPDAIFVFGDNAKRYGLGGQAKEMRGEPNALGVATLYEPGMYYRAGDPIATAIVAGDLATLAAKIARGATVYVPSDGLGTGLARLPESAPTLANLITAFFHACSGEPCPWEFI